MAEIFLARATGIEGFEKLVVLKRILPQLGTNQEFVRLFLDEARLAATLHHANIVQVYDVGRGGSDYFFAMEFVHGEDVRSILKAAVLQRREIPIGCAVSIVLGVCAGLHYAHEKTGSDGQPLGIIHRDVSPSNVLVSYDGGVKMTDFGIAKAQGRSQETRYGTVRGKFSYMSPEQCQCKPLDRRSDVFAIGILLYELTTCTKLFRAESDFEIMKQIVEQPASPPSKIRAEYPRDLERIVLRALERDRERRYATAEELQLDLETFAREHKLQVSPIMLGRFMQGLFGSKIEAWHEAQREGKPLASHVVETINLHVTDPGLPAAGAPMAPSVDPMASTPIVLSAPASAVEFNQARAFDDPGEDQSALSIELLPSRRKRRFLPLGAATALVVAGLALVVLHRTPQTEEPASKNRPAVQLRPTPAPEPHVAPPVGPKAEPQAVAAAPPRPPAPPAPPVAPATAPRRNIRRKPSSRKATPASRVAVPKPAAAAPAEPWDPDAPLPPPR